MFKAIYFADSKILYLLCKMTLETQHPSLSYTWRMLGANSALTNTHFTWGNSIDFSRVTPDLHQRKRDENQAQADCNTEAQHLHSGWHGSLNIEGA